MHACMEHEKNKLTVMRRYRAKVICYARILYVAICG
jgi:hypothetical protein